MLKGFSSEMHWHLHFGLCTGKWVCQNPTTLLTSWPNSNPIRSNNTDVFSTRKIIQSGKSVSTALSPQTSAIHLDVPHPPCCVYVTKVKTVLSWVKRGSSWTGPCPVCPRCQLEDALIRTGRRASVQLQARWWFLHYGEDDMEVMKGELDLLPDNIL